MSVAATASVSAESVWQGNDGDSILKIQVNKKIHNIYPQMNECFIEIVERSEIFPARC